MTLLGKLFRPWDLAVEEDTKLESKESQKPIPSTISQIGLSSSQSVGCDKIESSGKTKREDKKLKRQKETKNSGEDCPWDHFLKQDQYLPPVDPQLYLPNSAINTLANLSRNELTAMGLLAPDPPAMKVKRQRPKRFHCPHCQVAFSNNGQLRGHVRIHTGERPFTCEHQGCGKSFTRNEELTRHRRIHSGLRPYPCTYCGKKFGRKDHLKKHTRTHQRPMFNTTAGMIGFGNPFHPFNPPLVSNDFCPSYGLPFVLNMTTPNSPHFPFP